MEEKVGESDNTKTVVEDKPLVVEVVDTKKLAENDLLFDIV